MTVVIDGPRKLQVLVPCALRLYWQPTLEARSALSGVMASMCLQCSKLHFSSMHMGLDAGDKHDRGLDTAQLVQCSQLQVQVRSPGA